MKQSCRKTLQRLLFLITIVFANVVDAQTLPVQVTPQLIPPHSVKISDYATISNEKLFVNILLTDVNEIGRRVRLKMYIEGQGLNIATIENVVGANPIFLDGGVNLRLSNLDLQPYFQFNNLTGISPQQYNNPLPNGGYNYCFEVYDYFTGRRISEKSCTTVFLLQNDPPILNLPSRDNIVTATNPQNILFTWTPRHTNLNDVQYEFTLKELWDTQNPQAIFLGSVPFYQTTTRSTTLLVGPEAPQLISGKVYGWQVRAFVSDGINETSVFKNNGGSEIFWFKYLEDCRPPSFILSQALTAESVKIEWQLSDHIKYNIQYRKKGFGDDDWFDVSSYTNEGNIFNLEPDTVYEFRVGGECTPLSGFAYSSIQEFTTPTNDESAYYNCGITPEIKIENQELLPSLGINETFTAGDFPVTTREVTGSNGTFSGWGYITLPFLENLKEIIDAANILTSGEVNIGKYTRIKVEFESVKINTSKQLIEGVVKTTYDPDWGGIIDADEIINDIAGDNGNISTYDATDMDIDEVIVNEDGDIVIIRDTTDDGQEEEFLDDEIVIVTNLPVVITDENGDQWTVDEEGNVTQGTSAEGGQATNDNTNGVSGSGNVNEITSKDVSVKFVPSGYYGTDEYNSKISSDSYKNKYEFIKTYDDKEYSVLYKLVSDKPESTDIIKAEVTFANGKTKDDIVFKTKQGGKVDTEWSGNTATLTLKKQFDFGKDEIIATVKPKDSTQKYEVAGKLNTWHVKQREINLTLVSVNNTPLTGIKEKINEIYNVAGVNFNISEKSVSIGLDKLNVGDSDMLSNYTDDEKSVIQSFKDQNGTEKEQYYMFFFNDIELSKDIEGFMPLKRQFGFVFKKQNAGKIAAHELGHGIFGLKHPWDQYNDEGSKTKTDYLMDYGGGTKFSHMDWQKLHAPGIQIYWFQGDEAGEFDPTQAMIGYNVIPGEFSKQVGNDPKGFSFVTSVGKLITIPNNSLDVAFNGDGSLIAFTLPENGKKERYIASRKGDKFRGYLKTFDKDTEWSKRVYQDKLSNKKGIGTKVKTYTGKFNKTQDKCGIDLYEGLFKNSVDPNEWNSGGNGVVIPSSYKVFPNIESKKLIKEQVESPEACDLCNKGEEFYNKFSYLAKSDLSRISLIQTAKLMCEDPAFYDVLLAQIEKDFDENLDNIFWLSDKAEYRRARDAFWERDDAFEQYYHALTKVEYNINYYKNNLSIEVSEKKLNSALYYLNDEFIKTLSLAKKIEILQAIFKNNYFINDDLFKKGKSDISFIKKVVRTIDTKDLNELLLEVVKENSKYEFSSSKKEVILEICNALELEELSKIDLDVKLVAINRMLDWSMLSIAGSNYHDVIVKVIKSVTDDEANTFLNKLETVKGTYGFQKVLVYRLKEKLSNLLSQNDAYTEFYKELIRLTEARARRAPNEYEIVAGFPYNVDNKDYILVSFVRDRNNFIYKYDNSTNKVDILTCENSKENINSCKTVKIVDQASPFDTVMLYFIGSASPFDPIPNVPFHSKRGEISAKGYLVPVLFLEHLQNEKDNKQLKNFAWNTFNVVLTVATLGEGAAAITAVRVAAGSGIKILGRTVARNLYSLFDFGYTITKTTYQFSTSDKLPDGFNYIDKFLMAKGSFDLVNGGLKGLASLQKVKQIKNVNERREKLQLIIDRLGLKSLDDNKTMTDDQLEALIEKSVRKLENPKTDERLRIAWEDALKYDPRFAFGSLLTKIDGFDVKNVDFKNWVKSLDKESDLINKLDEFKGSDLENFAKEFNFKEAAIKSKFSSNPDLVSSWHVLRGSPQIRVKEGNLEILADVHKRFQYNNEVSFDGLNKLFNEGSAVASKQKLLDGLKEANKLFDDVDLPIEFSAIKKGEVTVNISSPNDAVKVVDRYGRGEEVGRYVDGILQKKKVIPDGDDVKLAKKGSTLDDDILQKGEEIGFRRLENVPSKLVEGNNIIRGSSVEYNLAKKRLKEYMDGEIYKIKNSGLPKERQDELIRVLNKKNKAFMEGKIGDISFDGNNVRTSGDTFDGEDIFSSYKVDKNGGINTSGSWIRNADTEYVMLSEIAKKLGAKAGKTYPNITGEIKIISELPYCMSCQGVIQDFSMMFPNVKVVLIDNLKY
ncbi:Fibronectin type III domain protein [Tenacibaculum sp. 190524A05c]